MPSLEEQLVSWVEELKPDDEVKVEILFPKEYVQYNVSTMQRFAQAAMCRCKAAALLGKDEEEFVLYGITVLQIYSLESILKKYGIILTHEWITVNGKSQPYFYADVTRLRDRLEEEFGGLYDS